jgi:hypothetical protein
MLNNRLLIPVLIHRGVKLMCLLASSLHTLTAAI